MKKKILALAAAIVVVGCGEQARQSNNAAADTKQTDSQTHLALNSGIDTSGMNKSVAASADMFRHTNGLWVEQNEIPADKARWGTFNVLIDSSRAQIRAIIEEAAKTGGSEDAQKIASLYSSYMDEAALDTLGLEPLKAELERIDQLANLKQVVEYWARAAVVSGGTPINYWVYADEKDPSVNVVYFSQSGLGLPNRDYYLDQDEKSQQTRQRYNEYLETLMQLGQLKGNVAKVFDLETEIAKQHWDKVKNRDSDLTYNKVAAKELGQWMQALGDSAWKEFLGKAGVAGQENYFVNQPSYLKSLAEITNTTSLDTWKLYFKLQLLDQFASKLNKGFADAHFDFHSRYLNGVEEREARWKSGVNVLNDSLGELLGKEYVAKHFPPAAKVRMKSLVNNLLAAYRESIKKLDWMGEDTKLQALDKLNKFRTKIGYPDSWRDYSALALSADDLVGNLIRVAEFDQQFMLNDLGKPVDRERWHMSPQTVNAYFNPVMNEIVFPAAILRPPFFDLNADDAVNYGAIGGVIGHEIGHGFDDQGAKYDGDGRLRNWWTENDLKQFQARTKKLVDQYNKFEVLPDVFVNGELTIGENIGDLGGLSIAYKAYQMTLNGQPSKVLDGFTGEQRVFLGWTQAWRSKARDEYLRKQVKTDPHSPAIFRVNGVMPNIDEFYQAFDVKPGDKMYLPPEDRVKIWK